MPSDQACKQFVEDLHNSYVAKRLAAFKKRKSSDVPEDTSKKAAAARLKAFQQGNENKTSASPGASKESSGGKGSTQKRRDALHKKTKGTLGKKLKPSRGKKKAHMLLRLQ